MNGASPDSLKMFFNAEPAYEDGTNVSSGTSFVQVPFDGLGRTLPWYNPAESRAPSNWKEKWLTLRTRFERLIDECIRVECVLIQSRIPAFGWKSDKFPVQVRQHTSFLSCGGLRSGAARLITTDLKQLNGVFPIKSARGDPILNENGEPLALRFGAWRYFVVQPTLGWRPEFGALPIPRLAELARDGTNLLYHLPSEIALGVWRNWLSGFSKSENSKESLWFDALFELSWQTQPGSSLHSNRLAWVENYSYGLSGDGLFPLLPSFIAEDPNRSVPHEHGYPLAYYSILEDVVRASISAIDEILERAELMKTSDKRFSVGLSFPGEHRPYVEQVAELLAGRVGKTRVLYDKFHEAEFAQPDLDVYLPNLYRTQCDLIAVFLCREYSTKQWCRLEWRFIRQLVTTTESNRIMFLSFDDIGSIPEIGILGGDGYVSINKRTPRAIADLILQRIEALHQRTAENPK